MLAQGVLSGQIVAESVTYLPAVLGGIVIGNTAHMRVPQRAFTLIVESREMLGVINKIK
jgi:hypothetical protein